MTRLKTVKNWHKVDGQRSETHRRFKTRLNLKETMQNMNKHSGLEKHTKKTPLNKEHTSNEWINEVLIYLLLSYERILFHYGKEIRISE